MAKINTLLAIGLAAVLLTSAQAVLGGNLNGRAGIMPAYYDAQLFTINLKELPDGGEAATLAHNGSINTIYESDDCPGFVAVLDAIQGDGFNPLWQEVQIHFVDGCQQLLSDDDIQDAFEAGLITLETTDEVYRCSVIGPKQ